MKKKSLHYNAITPLLHEVLKILMTSPEFESFRLVGGTALSLQRGHRESIDIDMFTDAPYGSIDFERIDTFLRSEFKYVDTSSGKIIGMGKSYFVGKSARESVKLDVYYTTDDFVQQPILADGIRMATTEEIIAMKMDIISRTGRKKDFWDIHELKDDYTLKQMLELHEKRHQYTHDAGLIKRKLEDFSKADGDFDPVCLRNKKWGLIKLDIIDFGWTDNPAIRKKEHLFIKLEADVPYRLKIKEGIDYINTLLYFSYGHSFYNKQIMMTLRNNSGETYSIPVLFDITGQTSRSLVSSELIEKISDYTFYYMELVSKEDIQFEFWIEVQEGGFMNL